MTRWVLFDYGEVLSLPQPEDERRELARTAGMAYDRFWERYWLCRPAYDRGDESPTSYWESVLQHPVGDALVQTLDRLDVHMWLHLNDDTFAIVRRLSAETRPLALLSNAPESLVRAIEAEPWAGLFSHRFYSARLGLSKPDPEIYRRVAHGLQARPEDIIFIDDREANIQAAAAEGIHAIHFTSAADLAGQLGEPAG